VSKPSDIPQDVWAASAAAYELVCDAEPISSDAITVIARFIMAERERCAAKADHFTKARNARRARELTTHEVYEVKIFARLIAAAIRGEA
jgi:hypothetical protein